MNEKDLLNDLQQIDSLLARCISPPLTRSEHDDIRQTMGIISGRVKLSFKLEKDIRDLEETLKEETETSE